MAAGMGAVTVSLDGLEASHDWMRGVPGSYQRALRAIGIIAAEPRLNADVVTCVNRRNLSELPEIYEILKGLGVKQWRLFTIIPIGRAAADPEMKLADSQFVSLMEFIQAKRQEGGPMKVTFSCEGYLGRYPRHPVFLPRRHQHRVRPHRRPHLRLPQHRPGPLFPGQHLYGQFLRGLGEPLRGLPQAGLGPDGPMQGLQGVARLPRKRHAQLAQWHRRSPPVPLCKNYF